ncbi:hypothetical protein AB6A40_005079 [Gnathostoma spinigerum]|uniref:Sushi domain-containing protein n=1 Tax=Gnathostoma spinigerum TaxID=75299 RepID=A0ABD6EFJ4_9BILA
MLSYFLISFNVLLVDAQRFGGQGCPILHDPPNGRVIKTSLVAYIWCENGYVIQGPRFANCSAGTWKNELGTCMKSEIKCKNIKITRGKLHYSVHDEDAAFLPFNAAVVRQCPGELHNEEFVCSHCSSDGWQPPIEECPLTSPYPEIYDQHAKSLLKTTSCKVNAFKYYHEWLWSR